jgi:hypothetical protein
MECHFQPAIKKVIIMAVYVQISNNSGESESESSCAYYYWFLFSGWWFNQCTDVALNGKYTQVQGYGFQWCNKASSYILPDRSEMKIRRIE